MSQPEKPDTALWPSVTFILETTGIADFSQIPNGDLYKQRGSDIHMICESIDLGEPDYWSDGELAGYAQAWEAFRRDTDFRPVLIETRVAHEQRRYKGRLDRAGYFGSGMDLVVLDLKGGIVAEWVRLQTAAYAACLPDLKKYDPQLPDTFLHPEKSKRCGVQLRKDGRYTISAEYKDYRADSNYFFSLVATVHGRSLYGKTLIDDGDAA